MLGRKRPVAFHDQADDEFEDRLAAWLDRTDPAMAWLGVLFGLLVGFQLAVQVRPPVGLALDIAGWVIWSIFVLDFVAKLALAPAKKTFLRRHWLQALGLLLPTLRLFSFLRLVRLGRAFPTARVLATSYRSVGTAHRLFRSRLGYLSALSVIAMVALAELAYVFESGADGTLPTFPDALVWSASVVVGMQADPLPATGLGQLIMIVGFVVGLVLIASLAGTIGAFLFDARGERESADYVTAARS